MTYTDFVEKIKSISASVDEYKALGLEDDDIAELISSHDLKKRVGDIPIVDDEVLKLIANYDAEKISIGMVNFLSNPYEIKDRVIFGVVEIDELAVCLPFGEIRCYEFESDHIMYKCAKNGASFLDALYEAESFLKQRMLSKDLYNNESLAEDIADYCAELAGGKQYKDFFSVMLS